MVEIFQDIRAAYDFRPPCEELAPYVEFFAQSASVGVESHLTGPTPLLAGKMFASYTPTCYINLGPAYVLDLADRRYRVQAGEDVLLLRNATVVRHKSAADNLFTLKFYPGGLEAVLGFSQAALADRLVPLNRVLPASLLAQLREPLGFAERVELLQQHLLGAYRVSQPPDHYVALVYDAIGEYQASGLVLNTSAVAERVFLTSKTINRYFHRVVGTSPSQYFALLRARAALTAFVAQPTAFAPGDYGYYDASHFAKAVRRFTGQRLPGASR
jgi:AraC-like DNA-binding protein